MKIIHKKDYYLEPLGILAHDNMGFSHCKLIELMGQGYEDILEYYHDNLLIEDSAKETKKTFTCLMRYIFFMCNFAGMNCLITRNTVALIQKTILKSFWKVIRILINKGITRLSEIKDMTRSNIEKLAVWPDGRVVSFISFENINSGIDCVNGYYARWLIEEPMQRDMPVDFNYDSQKNKFMELGDTLFRDIQQGWVTWPCCYKRYYLKVQVNMLFNDWDENMWINTDIVNHVFPWSNEYEKWILDNPLINYKKVKRCPEMVITPKIKGVTVIRTTKFISEFRDKKLDQLNIEALRDNNPFLQTAIIGKPFMGSDETVFIWRAEMLQKKSYTRDDFKSDFEKIRVYGWDGGKADNNVLTVLSFKFIDGVLRACVNEAPSYQIIKNSKDNLKKLDIIRLAISWIEEDIKANRIGVDWQIAFCYDDHEETTANIIAEHFDNLPIEFIPALKNGDYKIESRIKIIKVLLAKELLIIDFNANEFDLLTAEFWKQQFIWKNGEKVRDGIHFKNDFQNSLEYAVYASLNLIGIKKSSN